MRVTLIALLFAFFTAVYPQNNENKLKASDFGWLAGCWQDTRGEDSYIGERWTTAADMMIGIGWVVRGGKVASYEFLRIAEIDSAVHYIADPSDQDETPFKLTTLTEKEAVFENPEHDFPQRIVYTRGDDGGFKVRVEGMRQGKMSGFGLNFAKVRCED